MPVIAVTSLSRDPALITKTLSTIATFMFALRSLPLTLSSVLGVPVLTPSPLLRPSVTSLRSVCVCLYAYSGRSASSSQFQPFIKLCRHVEDDIPETVHHILETICHLFQMFMHCCHRAGHGMHLFPHAIHLILQSICLSLHPLLQPSPVPFSVTCDLN